MPDEGQPESAASVELGGVAVPRAAIRMAAVRSSGPGGQNVNKRSTCIQLRIALDEIPLTPGARGRLRRLAGSRLTEEGELIITSEEHRSQGRNREACLDKLGELIARALVVPKRRKATKPTRGAVQRRLDRKRQDSERKSRRRRIEPD